MRVRLPGGIWIDAENDDLKAAAILPSLKLRANAMSSRSLLSASAAHNLFLLGHFAYDTAVSFLGL